MEGAYAQGGSFSSGTLSWTVTTNQVIITTNPPANSGSQLLALTNGGISTVLPTVAGHRYILQYALGTEPGGGADTSTNGANWQPRSLTFTASTTFFKKSALCLK